MTIQNHIRQFLDATRPMLGANDGAAAVEFAIISAVLLPMLFAIIAFSTTLFAMNSMQSGAAEAARRVSIGAATYASGSSVTCASNPAAGSGANAACRLAPPWGTYTVVISLDCTSKDVTVTMTNNTSVALGDVYRFITGANYTTRAVTRWEGTTCP
jgi:Flp pilus assembly protein TadG